MQHAHMDPKTQACTLSQLHTRARTRAHPLSIANRQSGWPGDWHLEEQGTNRCLALPNASVGSSSEVSGEVAVCVTGGNICSFRGGPQMHMYLCVGLGVVGRY